ncbi:hypothetical protein Q7P37_009683 [Cladosporium fusiforme]
MEAYRHAHLAHAPEKSSHLTKLYTDAKKSAITNININPFAATHQETPEQFAALQRKFRIQKDRFITWGLAWSGDSTGPDGDIDESVAKAGLTEIVESVLGNVREVINELDNVRSGGEAIKAGEKVKRPLPFDESRYVDLLNDLTASNDTLYDLSRSRTALARGEHPSFSADQAANQQTSSAHPFAPQQSDTNKATSIAESDLTLVNPLPFLRPTLSPYAGLPPRIELTALRLPDEKPPPYESLGVPIATRLVGQLLRARASESVQSAVGSAAPEVSVLVEYANYDSTYQSTGVPPPLQRLEALSMALMPMRADSQHNISLLGYFEDPREPRIGLVYDLPYSVQNRLHATAISSAETLAPLSLLNLIRKARPIQPSMGDSEPPPLEARFKLALRLTEQLQNLHLRQLPHGNINSSSVIFAMTSNEASSRRLKCLKSPIWASFDVFSKSSVEGLGRPSSLNIYRHPEDHPYPPQRETIADIKFDLYSLALVLLEIGIWQSLGDMYKPKYSIADFKLRLEKLWTPKLASRCSTAYMRAVQTCLQAADPGNADSLTTEGIYEKVLPQLRRCCMLDAEADEASTTPEMPSYLAELSASRRQLPELPAELPPRRMTDASDLERTQSSPSTAPSSFSRLSSFSNLANAVPGPTRTPIRRRPVPSRANTLPPEQPSTKNSPIGSFQDFKRKVVIIQKRWRERCAQSQEAKRTLPPGKPDFDVNAMHARLSGAVGQLKPRLMEFPLLDIPQAIRDDWNHNTAVKLGRLVAKALKGSLESSSIELTSYGETPETARPTYLVTCSSTQNVKQILKRHFRCDSNACYVRVQKGKITRCRKSRRESAAQQAVRSMAPRYEQEYEAGNPDYQPQPMCGASIGAYKDEVHLPPVSFGGTVNIDGRPYGMSVHHMLEADEDEEEDFDDDDDSSDSGSVLSMSDEPEPLDSDDGSTVRQPSILSDISLDEDLQAEGDIGGISPGEGMEIDITQPALDDAISLNLHADEDSDDSDSDGDSGIAEDHILSYKLGQVHASSGLKRSAFHSTEAGYRGISSSLPQEIDWALFELLPPRTHPYNIVRGGSKFCTSPSSSSTNNSADTYPISIAPSPSLASTKVHCLGRTSGLASGTISSTMELLKLHGRTTFSASWTVHGGFGVGGDSGAWVISNEGKVCGHVLAERAGRTYICPMDLLFEDIRVSLGAGRVELPMIPVARGRAKEMGMRVSRKGREESVEAAVSRLNLGDCAGGGGGGGVPIPPYAAAAAAMRCESERLARYGAGEPLRSAG